MLKRLIMLCTLLLSMVYFSACAPQVKSLPKQICFTDRCIHIEIAQTLEERAKGFQNRKYLDEDQGMLFIFLKSRRHSFWMKDTFIALDIVWLNANKRIVTILPNILPCTTDQCPVYTPDKKALYVLEVNAGVTTELGLKVGDTAVFR